MPTPIDKPAGYWDQLRPRGQRHRPCRRVGACFRLDPVRGPRTRRRAPRRTGHRAGSGKGNAVAALAHKGIEATGIDLSPEQCRAAHQTWGAIPGARYVPSDVVDFLAAAEQRWDVIYSIWGALWFTDPQQLLPLIRTCLTPGGRLVFSHAPAVPGSYGIQGMYGNGFTGRQVWIYRWAYAPDTWAAMLHEHGFTVISARVEPAPEPDHVGTLIVESRA